VEKYSITGSVPEKEKARKLVFFPDDTKSTLIRNVHRKNSMLAIGKSPYSAQDVSFTLPKSARKITCSMFLEFTTLT
jgi:hypothetical protein